MTDAEFHQQQLEQQEYEEAVSMMSPSMMSPQINELAAALAKAQGAIKGAAKDSANPFFKTKYADLAAVWDACREALSANGLAVVQTTSGTKTESITVVTTLVHSSGQWMRGTLTMQPVKNDPQGIGSVITYARRYALAAMVGVAPEDDDGNAASGKAGNAVPKIAAATRNKFAEQIRACLSNGDDMGIKALWSEWDTDEKAQLWAEFTPHERKAMKDMKAAG